jgi:glycosyltransferase involved in cell wall biosynthesis
VSQNNFLKISVITVSFNQGEFIEENIKSVLNQNYPNVEHIIIDAGSIDNTLEILRKYDRYINWISEPDKGQSDGLNKGFKKAKGEIIAWINSDDKLAPGALFNVANFFNEHPEEIAVVGDQSIIDESGTIQKTIESRAYDFDYLLNYARGITQNSIFFKKEIFNKVGYLNESLHYAMDRDLFIRITSIKNIPYINKILAEFRLQPNAKTACGSYNFALELIKIRWKYGGRLLGPGNLNDFYIIITQPLRRIFWLRKIIQKIKKYI